MSGGGIVRIDFDYKKEERKLSGIEKEQFPFAVALALTRTAQQAQKVVQKETQEKFKLHTMFIPRNIKVTPAKKQDIQRFGLAEAFVGTTKIISFMTLQETGGIKVPKGRALSLPSEGLGTGAKTATGAIKQAMKPKALLAKADAGKKEKKSKGHVKPMAFVAKGMILIRVGPGRYPLKVLYKFEPRAKIKPRWEFERTVKTIAENYFAHNLSEALRFAVATAKEE